MSSSYRSNRLGLSHLDLRLCVEVVAESSIVVTWRCGFCGIQDLDDQLVSFSALTLLVWSSGL